MSIHGGSIIRRNPFKKLLKKEHRLIERLHEEQEAEAIAQERFQQAQKRLQRRRKRLEQIQGKLVHVRAQLAELQIIEHQPVYSENELVIISMQDQPHLSISKKSRLFSPNKITRLLKNLTIFHQLIQNTLLPTQGLRIRSRHPCIWMRAMFQPLMATKNWQLNKNSLYLSKKLHPPDLHLRAN